MTECILIDLRNYGGEGFMEMAPPSVRIQKKVDSRATGMCISIDGNGNRKILTENLGEADFLRDLACIKSAPFTPADLDAFYDYADGLDKIKYGNGQALADKITEEAKNIRSGKLSPSAGSLEAGTGSSE